jgi:uncharacterized protein (DUF1330 family)
MLLSKEEKHADDCHSTFHKEERRKNTWLALFCLISRITDPEGFQEYLKLAGPTVKQDGGRVLVGGAVPENPEGNWHPRLFSIGEFESVEQALRWYHSEENAPAKALRFKVAKNKGIVVQGLELRKNGPNE